MKKTTLVILMAAMGSGAAQAAEVSASVDFASAYVFRGVTLNNGLVMQPSLEVSGFPINEKYGSISVGIWANLDLDDEDGDGSDFSEVDYYITYTLPIKALDVSVTYTEYDYPDSTVKNDREITLSFGKALGTNGLYSSLAFNYGLDGTMSDDLYVEGALEYEKEISDELTASAGVTLAYIITEGADADGFSNATASAGLSYALNKNWSVGAGLTYIARLDDGALADMSAPGAYDGYDVDFLGTIGISCDF